MVAFSALLVAYMKIVGNADPDDRARKYLRWPIMDLSILMILCFTIDYANRIVHEMQARESGLILLRVFESIGYGLAHGLLTAFLLWQFTPLLLAYAKVSEKRQKVILVSFKGLVFLIGLADTADTISSIVIYITRAPISHAQRAHITRLSGLERSIMNSCTDLSE